MDRFKEIEAGYIKKPEEIPDFASGDTVRVRTWVREGNKKRIQNFEGVVIKQCAKCPMAWG